MSTVLELVNVNKHFGGIQAMNNVNMKFTENKIIGMIGPNGCGKSTTFNVISGVIPSNGGSINLFGQEIIDQPPFEINRMGLSRTYQNTRLWRNLTVIENLLLPPKDQTGTNLFKAIFQRSSFKEQERELIDKAYGILDMLEITHMANNYTSELSGGQSKLVDIGRVLMSDPKILLLDEPVAGVAGPLTEKIFKNIKKLKEEFGMTIVIIEHDMEFILQTGIDEIYVMNDGKIIANGEPDEIKNLDTVIDAYLGA